jgi:hypothetical protein
MIFRSPLSFALNHFCIVRLARDWRECKNLCNANTHCVSRINLTNASLKRLEMRIQVRFLRAKNYVLSHVINNCSNVEEARERERGGETL